MCLLIDNMCHRKRNDYKIDMAIDTFWHESIVHKIGKVLITAWNEWGEGAYLEPDENEEFAYLEALKKAINDVNKG